MRGRNDDDRPRLPPDLPVLPLFAPPPVDEPLPPHSDTATSLEAAESVREGAAAQRELVYGTIRDAEPCTRDDVVAITGLLMQSVVPRVWELMGNNGHRTRIELVIDHIDDEGRTHYARRRTRTGKWAHLLRCLPDPAGPS